jgi:hypothetical protein
MNSFFSFSFFDLFQIFLSIVGFGLAIYEIKRIKNSVEASKIATDKAFASMSDRSTIADIATIQSGVREIQIALRGERYEAALLRCQAVMENLIQLRSREGFSNNEKQSEIQGMVVNLLKLQKQLEQVMNGEIKCSISTINDKLNILFTSLTSWGEELKFSRGSISNDQ